MNETKKTVLVAVCANATIAVVKGIPGVLSGSSALLAECAHSIADTANQVMLLISIGLGERPPDEEHPFGYGKERFFWTLLAAVVIFVAGAIFSIGEAVLRLLRGGGGQSFWLAFTIAHVTGNQAFDAAAAILVGCLLAVVAWLLGHDTKGLLLGEAAPRRERDRLRGVIERHAEIESLLDLRTMYLGPESMLVAARVDLADDLPAGRIEKLADEIERELNEAVPTVDQVFLDPTGRRA